MRPSFLSLMRGTDGRKLGLLLAAILFVGGILANFGAGAAAGMGADGFARCSTGSSPVGLPSGQPADHGSDCCFTGHAPAPSATPPAADDGLPVAPRHGAALAAHAAGAVIVPLFLASEGPRGPPLSG
jgi:hypothetical protein